MPDTTTTPPDTAAPGHSPDALPPAKLRVLMGRYTGPRDIEGQLRMSEQLAKGRRAIPWQYRENPGDILALMQHAMDLDIGLSIAWDNLMFNTEGVGGMRARLIHALLIRAGHHVQPVHVDNKVVRMTLRRGDGQPGGGAMWTIAEAQQNGLLGKENSPWRGYPGDMLWARCISRLARRWAPDVVLGFYAAEELDDIADGGADEGLEPVDMRTAMTDLDGNLVPAPDVVALLSDASPDDLGQLRHLWKRAGEEGLMGAYAGTVDGVQLTVRDLLFDHMSAAEARTPRTAAGVPVVPVDLAPVIAAAGTDTEPVQLSADAPAGTGGKLDCGCWPAAVASAGRHEPGCTRPDPTAGQP